jgi:hypothetical protein
MLYVSVSGGIKNISRELETFEGLKLKTVNILDGSSV